MLNPFLLFRSIYIGAIVQFFSFLVTLELSPSLMETCFKYSNIHIALYSMMDYPYKVISVLFNRHRAPLLIDALRTSSFQIEKIQPGHRISRI